MNSITESQNLLECAAYWETYSADRICFTQPMGGGDANIKTWNWAEAVGEARNMASYLKSLDLPERSSIALCSKNCAHWLMADMAIWMAGHVSVPIFPILTEDIVKYIISHSEAKLLFVGKLDPVWNDMKQGVPADMKTVAFPLALENDHKQWDDIVVNYPPLMNTTACQADETATIIYTSGSTGTPKGVMISFEAMYQCGRGLSEYFCTHPDDRVLSYLPLAHVYERLAVQAHSLYAGFPLFFTESLDSFLHDLRRARPTLFASVPRLWLKFQLGVFKRIPPEKLDLLLKFPILRGFVKKKILKQLGMDKVRLAYSGSAPIPKEVLVWYRRLGLELLEAYGMTENFAYSHVNRSGAVRPGYVGNPLPGVEQQISKSGEILIKSPGNMKGYFKMMRENEKVYTKDSFLYTGDLGEIDEIGRLKIIGRSKELFKTSKGNYVAPAPIENMLLNHPQVEACYITGAGYHKPHGVMILSEEARQTVSEECRQSLDASLTKLLNNVNKLLPPFEQLAFLAIVEDVWSAENGFLTPTLKIKRQVLETTYSPLAKGWYAMQQPVIWQDVS
jgi:long-chain acyl-CoA synthetase